MGGCIVDSKKRMTREDCPNWLSDPHKLTASAYAILSIYRG